MLYNETNNLYNLTNKIRQKKESKDYFYKTNDNTPINVNKLAGYLHNKSLINKGLARAKKQLYFV